MSLTHTNKPINENYRLNKDATEHLCPVTADPASQTVMSH